MAEKYGQVTWEGRAQDVRHIQDLLGNYQHRVAQRGMELLVITPTVNLTLRLYDTLMVEIDGDHHRVGVLRHEDNPDNQESAA